MNRCVFYLGTHQPRWLERYAVPFFVSRRTMPKVKLPRALARWALDSGGFTELQLYGRWTITPEEYVAEVCRFKMGVGLLDWAAPMDWMCEPQVINGKVKRRSKDAKRKPSIDLEAWMQWARNRLAASHHEGLAQTLAEAEALGSDAEVMFHGTALSVEEHQRRTVANFLELRRLAPDLDIRPALQGSTLEDYHRCVGMYRDAGVDLRSFPSVLGGSLCRRNATDEIVSIVRGLRRAHGIDIHGLGVKGDAAEELAEELASIDTLAWSAKWRRAGRCPVCIARDAQVKNCANCPHAALAYREWLLTRLGQRRHLETDVRGWRQWDLFAA